MTSHPPVTFPRHAVPVPTPVLYGAPPGPRSPGGAVSTHRPVEAPVSAMPRSRVVARTARVDDLPSVLALVRQYRADAHAEGVLTGQTALGAAAAGFRRLLGDAAHRVVLAVLPGPNAVSGAGLDPADGESAVGLAVLGIDPLSLVLGCPQVTVETFVVHR